ncbi:MAG: right-handed parallel beta-helix repeat-containing protein [Pseudomonadota bacterium]
MNHRWTLALRIVGVVAGGAIIASLVGGSERIRREAVILVEDASSLNTALRRAQGGDAILLKPGVYSGVEVNRLSFDKPVTIRSESPAARATLTNFWVRNSKGLSFEDLEFEAQGPDYVSFQVIDSEVVSFKNIEVHGSLDGNTGNDGQGLGVLRSKDVQVTGSEFHQLHRALSMSQSENLLIAESKFHDLRTTGFVGAELTNVEILRNNFSNFSPVPNDHPDAIQFLTSGTKQVTRNITVQGNLISRGTGEPSQGIFFKDEVGTLPYEDVKIRDNLVLGTGYGGIYVIGARNLVATGNQLFSNPDKVNRTWVIFQNVDRAEVTDNQAISITFDNVTNLVQARNRLNQPVNDGGAAALKAWPGAAAVRGH